MPEPHPTAADPGAPRTGRDGEAAPRVGAAGDSGDGTVPGGIARSSRPEDRDAGGTGDPARGGWRPGTRVGGTNNEVGAGGRGSVDRGPGDWTSGPPGRGSRRALAGAVLRLATPAAVALAVWQGAVWALEPPRYILPSPIDVAGAFGRYGGRLAAEAGVTLLETLAGLVAGIAFGILTGVAAAASPLVGRVVTPLLVVSQALPVFALAPLLVLWFGFGLASKIVMTTLVIYFPVASSLADGLGRTDPGLLDIARLGGASRMRTLALIRFPAALPALVSGIRVAAVFAPIAAVIGEWVGAARGLGLLMVQANARMQTDLLFAALVILAAASLVLKVVVDRATRRLIPWAEAPDMHEGSR
jgi:putative hydroxymethylpyrimidine transport system permease protein